MPLADIVVLGAGVIGLTTALELHAHGHRVAIVAKDLPEDVHSTGFASPWAGCNWRSFETDPEARATNWDRITYKRLGKLAREHPDVCEKIPFIDVWSAHHPESEVWFAKETNLRETVGSPSNPLPANHPHGHLYDSYIMHAPKYIAHLASQARQAGIPIVRQRLSSLAEAYDVPGIGPVKLVINATGLGSKSLIGVEDPLVYPARGQTVLVRAPGVKRCVMQTETFMAKAADGEDVPKPAYIIPRPGPEGHVVLGGTYLPNNYSSLPDLAEAERILRACYALDPRLAGPRGESWEDIEIVSHNVGLRPAREGGARLELEWKQLGAEKRGPRVREELRGREVGVIHAYGFGSTGFLCSMGVAEEVVKLVDEYKSIGRAKL